MVFSCQFATFYVIVSPDLSEGGNYYLRLFRRFYRTVISIFIILDSVFQPTN